MNDGDGLAQSRVVVTGAGKGIGRATARLLAGRGAQVVAVSRTAGDLDGLRDEIGCETHVADLSDDGAVARICDAVFPADHLVNCAGTTTLEPFVDVQLASLDHLLAVNLRAPMVLSQAFARARIAAGGGGSIVNVSSVSAFTGFPDHAAYCASKGGLDAMMRVMANELGPHGIRVNAVNPVITLTPMAVKAWSDPAKSDPMKARIPMRRFVEPEEVAETIAYLLGQRALMIHGVSLPVDGGFGIA